MARNLADWLTHLESLHPKTIELGLARVEQVKARMGLLPAFPVIIVGGTNGKGSVCAMLESMLHEAGYKVGCYTSPHLLRYNERVRITKQQASDAELCASFEAIEQARGDVPLTYFEFGTLAAMQLFIAHGVDVAILEVGLGGRLDAVNVFDADVAVVTSVDIDHIEYLGDTREQIAVEKAGIFRAGKVAICADSNVPQALRDHAATIGAELWCMGGEFGFEAHQGQWDYRGKAAARHALPVPALRGAYQLGNASAALAVLDVLGAQLPVEMAAVRRGLLEVVLPGRFQVLPGRPQWILDVAHNPHAALSLAANLAQLPPARTIALMAMLGDKDIAGVMRALAGRFDAWVLAGLDVPRGTHVEELARVFADVAPGGTLHTCPDVAAALREARHLAGGDGRIAAFGSFYTVAEAMSLLERL